MIEENIIKLIESVGEDPNREGLKDTPKRFIRSWEYLFKGYKEDPKEVLSKTFTQDYDEMVLAKNIELYSTCEHHLLPFYGKCHVAYIPNGKVVGISKLSRLVETFARRMQIQERLTKQITDSINEILTPLGVAVVIEAKHMCMMARGIEKQNSSMTTSAMLGVFRSNPSARAEFLQLIRG